jgi:hypothetical protein
MERREKGGLESEVGLLEVWKGCGRGGLLRKFFFVRMKL